MPGTGTVERIPLAALVEDFSFYPRFQVDSVHVARLAEALRAGAEFPPIIADRASRRIVDGFHRRRAYLRVLGDSAVVAVVLRDYSTDADMLLDAIRCNAGHGRRLTPAEEVRAALLAREHKVSLALVADALAVRVEALTGRIERTVASGHVEHVVLKPAYRHLAGEKLTVEQELANKHAGGHQASFYARMLIELIEADAVNLADDVLVARLHRLYDVLGAWVARHPWEETASA